MTALSIITICRNNRDGLQRTLDSVMSQTAPPTELIVVDGASTDGTPGWLASTGWPPYFAWKSEPDDGIYDAMNRGMGRLRERGLVMFLNAGDWLADSETLASIRASYESQGWSWAVGRAMTVDVDGQPLREMIPRSPSKALFTIGLGPIPHPATVFSAALLEQVGKYDPRAGIAADQQYMFRCWLCSPPFALRMPVANFDCSGVSSTVEPWFCTQQMRAYRLELGRPLLGSRPADFAITRVAMGIIKIASVIQPQVRIRRMITLLRSPLLREPH